MTAKDHGLRVRATKPKVTRAGHAKYDWRTAYTTNKKTKGTITLTREVSNGFSATIGFSKKAVDASVGFNVTKSMKVSVKIPYKTSGKRKERIQWAPKYNIYKVKRYVYRWQYGFQTKRETQVATVKKFAGFVTRVI